MRRSRMRVRLMSDIPIEEGDAARVLQPLYDQAPDDVSQEEIDRVLARAKQQLAMRDVLTLGFTQMLQCVLVVLAGLFRGYHGVRSSENNEQ